MVIEKIMNDLYSDKLMELKTELEDLQYEMERKKDTLRNWEEKAKELKEKIEAIEKIKTEMEESGNHCYFCRKKADSSTAYINCSDKTFADVASIPVEPVCSKCYYIIKNICGCKE